MLIIYFPYSLGYPCAQHDRYIIVLALFLAYCDSLHRKICMSTCALLSIGSWYTLHISQRLAIWLLHRKVKAIPSRIDEATIRKCSESMWKFTYYATVEICALNITWNEPWFRDTKEYFRGWPHQAPRWVIHMLWIFAAGDDSCLPVMHTWSSVDGRNAFIGLGYQVFSRYLSMLKRLSY